jgi:hypothetical protein
MQMFPKIETAQVWHAVHGAHVGRKSGINDVEMINTICAWPRCKALSLAGNSRHVAGCGATVARKKYVEQRLARRSRPSKPTSQAAIRQ